MNHHLQQQQQNMQMGSGLTRYRSAPSSYFASLLDSPTGEFSTDDFEQLFNPRASSPETQKIFSRFINGTDENCASNQLNSQFPPPRKAEQPEFQRRPSNEYNPCSSSPMMFQSHSSGSSYGGQLMGSISSSHVAQMKIERADGGGGSGGGGGGGGLIRHSSSPAGLFADINIENEFGTIRAMGNFGGGNNNANASRFKSQMHTSSGMMMDPISEIGTKNSPIGEDRGHDVDYITGYPINSWDDNFLKGVSDNDTKGFSNTNASDDQNNEGGNRSTNRLAHHLSLPTSSAELSSIEKLLQDSVPCKLRAKRGFATHPRSIAERVRRTKISERMRKLQELVPNMDKQTNTSDMLDLAVDYIKDLQKQVKTLSDNRIKCSCSAK